MCFHSPYAEFWHLYTFPKLLSISKEINFCLDLCCNSELVLGAAGSCPRRHFSSSKGSSVLWWLEGPKRVVLSTLGQKLGPSADREEEMAFVEGNKPFSRPTSCGLGLSAICVFVSEREKSNLPACVTSLALARRMATHGHAVLALHIPTPFSSPIDL